LTGNYPDNYLQKSGNTFSGGLRAARAFAASHGYYPQNSFSYSARSLDSYTLGTVTVTRGLPYTGSAAGTYVTNDTLSLDVDWRSQSLIDGNLVNLTAKATANANAKVRDQKVGLGEALAEAGKTYDMAANMLKRITRGYVSCRKAVKQPSQFVKHVREAARHFGCAPLLRKKARKNETPHNLWLEYRYGWLPLVSTVKGAVEALDRGLRSKDQILVVRSTVSEKWNVTTYTSNRGVSYPSNPGSRYGVATAPLEHNYRNQLIDKRMVGVQIGYIVKVTNPNLAAGGQLGLDPVTTGWELVPFSFVVDWFANVGDVIEQLTAFNGVTFLTGWKTVRRSCKRYASHQVVDIPYTSGHTRSVKPSSSVSDCIDIVRTVLTTPPAVGLYLNNGLNTTRFFDALALAAQKVFR